MGDHGALGHEPSGSTGETPNISIPTKIRMPHEKDGVELRFIQVSAGAYHTLAIDEDENVRSFGSGRRGRLGHPPIGSDTDDVDNNNSGSNRVGGGSVNSSSRGGVGDGLSSQSSRLSYHNMARPQLVIAMKDLGCGGLMLQSNDTQWAFLRNSLLKRDEATFTNDDGGNVKLSLGGGSNLGAMAKAISMIACGRSHTIALTRGGQIWCWGSNDQGQLGIGMLDNTKTGSINFQVKKKNNINIIEQKKQQDLQNKWFPHASNSTDSNNNNVLNTNKMKPVKLPDVFGGATVVQICCGSWHTMCLTHRGISSTVFVWGRATEGQLGNGTEGTHIGKGKKRRLSNATSPNVVPSLSGLHVRSISCGDMNCAAVLAHGMLFTWGEASLGKLGHGFNQKRQLTPNLVRGALTEERVTSVSLGFEHSGCVTESGNIYTWGNNFYGRLGLGDENNRYTPTLVSSLSNSFMISVSCGGYHTMAINRKGQLYVWGKADARLGLGSLGRGDSYGDATGSGKCVKIPRLHHLLETKSYDERINHLDRRDHNGSSIAAPNKKDNNANRSGGVSPENGKGKTKSTKIVSCCAAFEHSMVMTSSGQLLTFGINTNGKKK
jgi:alpha-tubulin suppressor-like RCC1 family protein